MFDSVCRRYRWNLAILTSVGTRVYEIAIVEGATAKAAWLIDISRVEFCDLAVTMAILHMLSCHLSSPFLRDGDRAKMPFVTVIGLYDNVSRWPQKIFPDRE